MTTQTRQFDRIVARIDRDQLQYSRPCGASAFLDYLDEHGYVIVHPDDVTEYGLGDDYEDGWNACRALIFGETAE